METKSMKSNESIKSEIIVKFLSRPKVKIYLDYLKTKKYFCQEWINDIKGIGEETKSDLSDLFKLYGINPDFIESNKTVSHGSWWYDMESLKENDLDFYLPLFFIEFSIYPVTYIKNSKLEKIYFVNSLNFATDAYSQYRAAVPDYWEDSMAMVYCCKETSTDYIKNVIHHEFFHFVDYIEDGKIYGSDPEWDVLNAEGFKYGNGGANNREYKTLDNEINGFLNFYSTTGIEEDKAEIFAHMITKPQSVTEEKNEILLGKFEFMKRMMKRFDSTGLGQDEFWGWIKLFR